MKDTISIPSAISTSAGLASSPGGRESAAFAMNGQASSPQSGIGVMASAASSWV